MTTELSQELARFDEMADSETQMEVYTPTVAAALNKSEVEAQVETAHRFKRSITSFLKESQLLSCRNQAIAEACIYALPRDGKLISGPSVRLAEIMASAYGNLHIGARVVDVGDKEITAQGVAWDLEKNVRVSVETKRRITSKSGKRYSDDMVVTTGNAAASIALRNAIFRVIPRAYVDQIYALARQVAVGDAKTLVSKRDDVIARLVKMGATQERIFGVLGIKGADDVTLEHIEILIGLGTSVKNGDRSIDDAFPAPLATLPAAEEGKRMSLKPSAPAKAEKKIAVVVEGAEEGKPAEPAKTEEQKPIDTPQGPLFTPKGKGSEG